MAAGAYRNLLVWQEAMKLAELVYRQTLSLPKAEVFGLTSQMRRAAVSIPSNIAEGAGRNSTGELLQFLGIASGSLAELETQEALCVRLGYFESNTECARQMIRVGKLLIGMRRNLRSVAK
jgi:four helix bundle protein